MKGKRNRVTHYLCEIVEICDEDVHVKFLQRTAPSVYVYPTRDDYSWEPMSSLTMLDRQPTFDNRQRYCFLTGFDPLA
jgi:hypothetical protein